MTDAICTHQDAFCDVQDSTDDYFKKVRAAKKADKEVVDAEKGAKLRGTRTASSSISTAAAGSDSNCSSSISTS